MKKASTNRGLLNRDVLRRTASRGHKTAYARQQIHGGRAATSSATRVELPTRGCPTV